MTGKHNVRHQRVSIAPVRTLADQAFSRAAGAPLIEGNHVQLLRNAQENYPAWLSAIAAAKRHIHFESYIIHDDDIGREFADALISRAQEGVRVRLIYDWLGGFGKTSRRFWNRLRAGGVEVRCYNPPRIDSPLGWVSRDHRKMLAVDGNIAFITGLCVGRMWVGDPGRKVEPWRDTGVAVRGPAVAHVESRPSPDVSGQAMGDAIPTGNDREGEITQAGQPESRGRQQLFPRRQPVTCRTLIGALARRSILAHHAYLPAQRPMFRLWERRRPMASMSVFFFRMEHPHSQALIEGWLPAAVGWRGSPCIRVERPMLHAKASVAAGAGALGSSNLNVASWLGIELDASLKTNPLPRKWRHVPGDLTNATEIVLDNNARSVSLASRGARDGSPQRRRERRGVRRRRDSSCSNTVRRGDH